MKERPTSVTVFAVINLVFGALGVLGLIFWLLNTMGVMPQPPEKDVLTQAMEDHGLMSAFSNITSVLGFITTPLSIAASIALFTLKPWARKVTIGLSTYAVAAMAIGFLIALLGVMLPLLPDVSGQDRMIVMFGMIVGGVFNVLLIGYNLLLIFMFKRPHVVEAFTSEPLEDGDDDWDAEPTA